MLGQHPLLDEGLGMRNGGVEFTNFSLYVEDVIELLLQASRGIYTKQ